MAEHTNRLVILFLLALLHFAQNVESSHPLYNEHHLQELAEMKLSQLKEKGVTPSNDAYRSGYHFQPVSHWLNDPNAPMFYKGYYHLFYQYNPQSAVWGMIRWGHAVSKDLINWRHLAKAALYPDQWYDINGAWSGSATFVKKKMTKYGQETEVPVILYTGNTNESVQVSLMAYPADPNDPLLLDWVKDPRNPIMVPDAVINVSSFRDPTTAWLGPHDKQWRTLVGNKKFNHNNVGVALLYRTKDFVKWTKARHPIHSAPTTGMWECPDLFPVALQGKLRALDASAMGPDVKHVLKNSLDNTKVDYYTVGRYLPDLDKYVPDKGSIEGPDGLRYDYGKFYASKTFFDQSTHRRILWGWINESDSVVDDVIRGWAGLMAIPRVVSLDPLTKGSVIQWPVAELESLRGDKVPLSNVDLQPGSNLLVKGLKNGAGQVDVEVVFETVGATNLYKKVDNLGKKTAATLCRETSLEDSKKYFDLTSGGFGLRVLASLDLKERSSVLFKFFQDKVNPSLKKAALCVDQSRSTLKTDADTTSYGGFLNVDANQTSFSLRVLVDHSIVESFAEGGKTCITSRSYPTKAVGNNVQLFAFNSLASHIRVKTLNMWTMKNAQTIYEALV